MHNERRKERNDHEDAYEIIEVADQYDVDQLQAKIESLKEALAIEQEENVKLKTALTCMRIELDADIRHIYKNAGKLSADSFAAHMQGYCRAWAKLRGIKLSQVEGVDIEESRQ